MSIVQGSKVKIIGTHYATGQTIAQLTNATPQPKLDTMVQATQIYLNPTYSYHSSGDPKIREIQMNLNRDYHNWIGLKKLKMHEAKAIFENGLRLSPLFFKIR